MPIHKGFRFLQLLCAFLLMLSISAVGLCADAPPLPTDINIVPPGANVSEDLAKLSGKWVGTTTVEGKGYSGVAQHVLIVEQIDEVGVITVIYSRGDFPSLRTYPKGFWARYKATWGADTKELRVSYPYQNAQVNIAYKLTPDGKLVASGFIGSENKTYKLHRE